MAALSFLEAIDAGVFHLERPGAVGVGPVRLYPIQREFFREVFDTYIDGTRRYRKRRTASQRSSASLHRHPWLAHGICCSMRQSATARFIR